MRNLIESFIKELNSLELEDKETGRKLGLVKLEDCQELLEILEIAILNEFDIERIKEVNELERNFKRLRGGEI